MNTVAPLEGGFTQEFSTIVFPAEPGTHTVQVTGFFCTVDGPAAIKSEAVEVTVPEEPGQWQKLTVNANYTDDTHIAVGYTIDTHNPSSYSIPDEVTGEQIVPAERLYYHGGVSVLLNGQIVGGSDHGAVECVAGTMKTSGETETVGVEPVEYEVAPGLDYEVEVRTSFCTKDGWAETSESYLVGSRP